MADSYFVAGELCYATSFNIKEPDNAALKFVPELMMEYVIFLNKISRSPFQNTWLWLKPRGLDRLVAMLSPKNVQTYTDFTNSCLVQRMSEEQNLQEKDAGTMAVRKDMIHYLFQAKDPETGGPGYTHEELVEENNLLVVAGADTTSTTFAAIFFYLTRNPNAYRRVTSEIRATFKGAEEIRSGKELNSCRYLRACIEEALRMNPPVGADLPREVLAGGIDVCGQYLPKGTDIAVSAYSLHHNEEIFPDPSSFKPERWIPDEDTGVTAASVARSESAFAPFSIGSRGCPGKNLAYLEMSIVVAKVLFLSDVRAVEGNNLGAGRADLVWGRRNEAEFQTWDMFVASREGPVVQFKSKSHATNMTIGKAGTAAAETIYTPRRRGTKYTEDQQIPWTELVARSRAKAPVRRLSASEESRSFRSSINPPQGTFGEHWRSKRHLKEGANAATFFGFPTIITPQPHLPGEFDLDAIQSYTKFGHMAGGSLDNNEYLDFAPPEYPSRSEAKNELHVRFTEEEETTDDSDFGGSKMTLAEQVRNAFTIHALNQSVGVGLLNEFASHGQKLKLTLHPRTRILGHNASLWLKDYTFDTFRCLAAALVLHEQQTWGYPRTGHSAKDKPKLNFVVDIEKPGQTKTYKIYEKTAAAKTNFEKHVLPAIKEADSDNVRIRVRTEALACAFDCECYHPGELEFEAPDYGSLRVVADWHLWHRREIENSLNFEEAFLDQIFPPVAHAGQTVFDLELPDGQTFRIVRSADPTEIPTLNAHVQDALSRTITNVTKENIEDNKIKVWIRAESATQTLISRPQESPSQKSPGLARANGTILVYRPARVTQFRYDAPHTMQRFFALVRAHLYPDAPEHGLRLRIGPSDASRKEGRLLAPIVESQDGYTKPDKVGQSLEDFWKDDFLRNYLSAEEDPWAVRVFVSHIEHDDTPHAAETPLLTQESIKVFNGTAESDIFRTWDTHLFYMRKEIRDVTSDWNKPPKSLMDGLAKISKSLLGVDPQESELGIVLHVKREAQVGQRKEWLQWSKKHSLTEFLTEVLYKIDGDEIAIYPGDYEESSDSTVLRMKETAENMRRTRKTGSRTNGLVDALSTHTQTPARAHAVQGLLPATTRSSHNPSSLSIYNGLGPSARLPPSSDPVMLQFDTTTRPQTYSATEMSLLRHRLHRTENELRLREESCKVCGKVFMASAEGGDAIRKHYETHRPPPPRRCPQEGCSENLDDCARYPSFDLLIAHISSHGDLLRCSTLHCYCPIRLLTPQQYEEHLRIHPIESAARSSIRRITRDTAPNVPAQITVREHASTQTDLRERWEEPKERSGDSLKQHPKATSEERGRLRCSVCHSYVDHLSAWDLDDHAEECGTTRDNFYIVPNIRPGKSNFNNDRELHAAPKPKQTRSRATKRQAETQDLTAADNAEGGDASAAPRPTKRT
ncbi:MAG: hypothetical protein Q9181_006643, partial [Wetmoreana brouardii]